MNISIIIPAHNEEENIVDLINKIESLLSLDYELIVVNDHSIDSTKELVEGLSKKYSNLVTVNNAYESGFANAVKFGFVQAKGEVILLVMGDSCDDLNTIPKMLEKIIEGYDVVCGSRYIKQGARLGGSKIRGALSAFTGWSLYFILGIPTHDIANAFKMYKRNVIESININAKSFELSMELPLKAYYAGFKITEVPTIWREREKGKSSFRIFNLIPNYSRFYLWAIKKRILK